MKSETQHLEDVIKKPPNGFFKHVVVCTLVYKKLWTKPVNMQDLENIVQHMHFFRDMLELLGAKILYYDTDMLSIYAGTEAKAAKIVDTIQQLDEAVAAIGQERMFDLKFEHYLRCAFSGKSKLYAALVNEKGKKAIKIVGFKCMRSDTVDAVKQAERKAIELLLNDDIDGLLKLVRDSVEEFNPVAVMEREKTKIRKRSRDEK